MQQQSKGKTFVKTSRGKESIVVIVIIIAFAAITKLFSLLRF